MVQHETDVWVDKSAVLNAGGRCAVTTADTCVDGPATKAIEGRPVTRACWSYERTLTCTSGAPVDECAAAGQQRLHAGQQHLQADECRQRAVRDHPGHLYLPGRRANHNHRLELPGQRLLPGYELLQYQLHQRCRLCPFDVADGSRTRGRRVSRHQQNAGLQGRRQPLSPPPAEELLQFRLGWRRHDQSEPVRYRFEFGLRRADEFPEPRVPLPGHAGLAAGWRFQRQLHHLWHHRRGQRHGTTGQFGRALFR
jgi:hypothetical protein